MIRSKLNFILSKIVSLRFFIILLFHLPGTLSAYPLSEEAKKLIMRHIEMTGGEQALFQIQSISRHGHIAFYIDNKNSENYCYHTDIIYPTKLREQIKGKEILYDRGTDGISYWLWIGNQYEYTQDHALIDYMRDTSERANRDMLWVAREADNYTVLATAPTWAPYNNQCIQQIKSSKIKRIYCFDNNTGILSSFGNDEEYRLLSDWQEVGNIKIPFHLSHYQKNKIIFDLNLDYAYLNKPIPDKQFMKPDEPQLAC